MVGFVATIVLIITIIQRSVLQTNGESRVGIKIDEEKVTNDDGSVSVTRTRRNHLYTPKPGYEYVDDALLGEKSNLSLIGVAIALVFVVVWGHGVIRPGKSMF